ncbi:MAG: hypothetical protein ACI9VM_000345 [Candidatus Azotimanducaceae bacterium]|jgi:hypothetical protein
MDTRPLTEKKVVRKARRHWLTIAFLLGFIVDNITLNRVDQLFDNIMLATYVILAMASLLFLYASTADCLPERMNSAARKYSPLVVQYSFGGLLSGMLIFYGRSGAWMESWPFLTMFLVVIYLNETIHDRVSRLIYNLAILFIGLFSYTVLVIPVFTGFMGPWVFVGSGLVALFIMYWFVQALHKVVPHFLTIHMKAVVFTLGIIFASFNFLYFANVIPPIPLSLKDVGIYHSVVRFETGDYQLKYEEGSWWQFFKDSDDVFHARTGDSLFCFAQVFAPTRLATDIYHRWEYYDDDEGKWIEHDRLSYNIAGGRDDGFRGYTLIQNYRDGAWRCSVETERGQVLGREEFEVDSEGEPRELVTKDE